MPGKLKITGNPKTPRDPMQVKAYCEGRAFAKAGNTITFASGVTGTVGANNAIRWTAKIPGNGIEVNIVNAGVSQQLGVSVSSNKVYIGLATNGSGVATSTATEVIAAVAANTAANAFIGGANEGASTGAGVPVVGGVVLSGSNYAQVASDQSIAFAAGATSWTADPTGVGQDACALPYGGGHV
jgi:hypothetical protein